MFTTRSTVDRLQLLYNYLKSKVPPAEGDVTGGAGGEARAPAISASELSRVSARSVLKLYRPPGAPGLLNSNGIRQSLMIFLVIVGFWYYFSRNPFHDVL